MEKLYSKISKEVQIIILSESEDDLLPDDYIPVAGCFVQGKQMLAAISEKIAFENNKLAQKIIDEAQAELINRFM